MVTFTKNYDCALHSYGPYPQYHKCLLFTIQTVYLNHVGHNMSSSFPFRSIKTAYLYHHFHADVFNAILAALNTRNSFISSESLFGKFSKSKYKAMISGLDKNNAQCHHQDSEQKHWKKQTNKIQSVYFIHLRRQVHIVTTFKFIQVRRQACLYIQYTSQKFSSDIFIFHCTYSCTAPQ